MVRLLHSYPFAAVCARLAGDGWAGIHRYLKGSRTITKIAGRALLALTCAAGCPAAFPQYPRHPRR